MAHIIGVTLTNSIILKGDISDFEDYIDEFIVLSSQ